MERTTRLLGVGLLLMVSAMLGPVVQAVYADIEVELGPAVQAVNADSQAEAAKLIDSGRTKVAAQDFDGAVADLTKALELDPENDFAKNLLKLANDLKAASAEGGADKVTQMLKQYEVERMLKVQMARLEMENKYVEGTKLLREGKYDTAIERLKAAWTVMKWLEPQTDVGKFRKLIENALNQAEKQKKEAAQRLAKEREEQARAVQRAKEQEERNFEQRRIRLALDKARHQYYLEHYQQALMYANAALDIDPDNRTAKRLVSESQRRFEIQQAHADRATMKTNEEQVIKGVKDISVPQAELLKYPDNWQEILERPAPGAGYGLEELDPEEAAWREKIATAMKQTVTLAFADSSIDAVLRFLHELTGVNFWLDPEAIKDIPDRKINVSMTDATLESALKIITGSLGLDYTLEDESVKITTPEKAKGNAVLRLYDVSDLIVDIRDFTITTEAITMGEGDSGDGGLFNQDDDDDQDEALTGEELVEFIKNTIEPDSWTEIDEL